MSMQQAALPTQAGSGPPATAEPAMPPGEDVAGIGRQAADIIEPYCQRLTRTTPGPEMRYAASTPPPRAAGNSTGPIPAHDPRADTEPWRPPGPVAGTTRRDWRTVVNDNEILAVEEAAALLESCRTDGQGVTRLHSAVATAITHGKAIKDVAAAAHLTALEVLDAVDAATYPHPVLPVHDVEGRADHVSDLGMEFGGHPSAGRDDQKFGGTRGP
jgi:hypothetical protein